MLARPGSAGEVLRGGPLDHGGGGGRDLRSEPLDVGHLLADVLHRHRDGDSPWKGTSPVSISYSTTPSE